MIRWNRKFIFSLSKWIHKCFMSACVESFIQLIYINIFIFIKNLSLFWKHWHFHYKCFPGNIVYWIQLLECTINIIHLELWIISATTVKTLILVILFTFSIKFAPISLKATKISYKRLICVTKSKIQKLILFSYVCFDTNRRSWNSQTVMVR